MMSFQAKILTIKPAVARSQIPLIPNQPIRLVPTVPMMRRLFLTSVKQHVSLPKIQKNIFPHNRRMLSTNQTSQTPTKWWEKATRTMQGWQQWSSANTILARFAKLSAGSAILLPALDIMYTFLRNRNREREMTQAFLAGSVPDVDLEYLVERPGISEKIRKILMPPKDYSSYRMIVGYHGTGKTTLVKQVGHQVPGVVYVDVLPNQTSDEEFAKSLAKGLSWSPPIRSWTTTFLEKFDIRSDDVIGHENLFDTVFHEFCRHASHYRKNNGGHSPVLIIDNVNRLAVRNPVLLEILQDFAKDAADNREFITVFVTSEGHAPLQLLGRSAASRLGPIVTVGDLNFQEVQSLLRDKYGATGQQAQDIYELVGGRVKLIRRVMSDLAEGMTLTEVKNTILCQAKNDYMKAKLREDSVFSAVALKISKVILEHGRIHEDQFFNLAGTYDQYVVLLSGNIFATVPYSDWITFQSKPVEIVMEQVMESGNRG